VIWLVLTQIQFQNTLSGCGRGQVQVLGDFDGIDMHFILAKEIQEEVFLKNKGYYFQDCRKTASNYITKGYLRRLQNSCTLN